MSNPVQQTGRKLPFIVILLIVAGCAAGSFVAYRSMTPDVIRGELLDMALVTQKDGSRRLWILCDDSFRFTQTTNTTGRSSMRSKCLFCTTLLYVYDPAAMKIVKKIETERNDIAVHQNIFLRGGRLWVIQGAFGSDAPRIDVYDAETAAPVADTASFVSKHPRLQAGLVSVSYRKEDGFLSFTTKDGRDGLLFDMDTERFFDDYTALSRHLEKRTGTASTCVLSPERSSGPRKRLFLVTAPAGSIIRNRSSLEMFADNANMMRMAERATARRLGDRIYLEGIIYHQDAECALIIHLDRVGKQSNRMLTCVDLKQERERWTVRKEELFDEMRIDEDDESFSSLFFTKDDIKVLRSGNLVALSLKGAGVMGFDFASGKKLWELDI